MYIMIKKAKHTDSRKQYTVLFQLGVHVTGHNPCELNTLEIVTGHSWLQTLAEKALIFLKHTHTHTLEDTLKLSEH